MGHSDPSVCSFCCHCGEICERAEVSSCVPLPVYFAQAGLGTIVSQLTKPMSRSAVVILVLFLLCYDVHTGWCVYTNWVHTFLLALQVVEPVPAVVRFLQTAGQGIVLLFASACPVASQESGWQTKGVLQAEFGSKAKPQPVFDKHGIPSRHCNGHAELLQKPETAQNVLQQISRMQECSHNIWVWILCGSIDIFTIRISNSHPIWKWLQNSEERKNLTVVNGIYVRLPSQIVLNNWLLLC